MTWINDAGGNDGVNSTLNIPKSDTWRHGVLFLPLKALLVEVGWHVKASGDGLARFEFEGTTGGAGTGSGGAYDVWTVDNHSHGGAGNVSNALAWCVLEDPDGNHELLLVGTNQTGSTWDGYGSVLWLHGGGYLAAGCTASVPPATVAGEQGLRAGRVGGGFAGQSGAELVSQSTAIIQIRASNVALADNETVWSFYWCVTTGGSGITPHDMVYCCPIYLARSWEVAPYVFLMGSLGQEIATWESKGQAGERWLTNANGVSAIGLDRSFWGDQGLVDPVTGKVPLGHMAIVGQSGVASREHFRGVYLDVLQRAVSTGTPNPAYPNITPPDVNDRVWLHFARVCLPWHDGPGSPPTPSGTGPSVTTDPEFIFYTDIIPPPTPPVPTAPTIGTVNPVDRQLDSDEPLTFQLNNVDLRAIICIEYASLGFTELAYDGTSFTAAYSPTSSVVSLGGGSYSFSIRRSPVWPSDPQLRVFAFNDGAEL